MKRIGMMAILPCLLLCLATGAAMGEPLRVFVGILPLKGFVERIGGEYVAAEVLVSPGHSPETYEPTPRQMAALSTAKIYFAIGMPFETLWIPRIKDTNRDITVVACQKGIQRLAATHHHHHHAGEEHSPEDGDPHVWTSPVQARQIAANIAAALETALPEQKEYFRGNCQKLTEDLGALEREIRDMLAPVTKRRFMVFHPSWGYFAQDFGLEQIAIEADGKEPGAKTLALLIDRARKENIRVVLVQAQFSHATADTIASAIGGKVVAIDPLAEDYFANLRKVAQTMKEAMTP